jgi:hypothetical protein
MDHRTLVTNQIEDAGKLIARLTETGFPVLAASWLKESDSGEWYLYLVTPAVDEEGQFKAYRRIHPVLWGMWQENLSIHPFDIKLVGPSEPVAKALADVYEHHPRMILNRYNGARLGNVALDAAYIYPPIAAPSA